MRRLAVPAVASALLLAGCGATSVESDPVVEGARGAVQAYVDAIGALDLDTATAMTSPEALVAPTGRTPPVDVTAALPEAIAGIEDAWIAYDGTDFTRLDEDEPGDTTDVVWFTVSYAVDGIAGADSVEVTRIGDDAGDVDDWIVTDALVVQAESFVDDAITESSFGGVAFETDSRNAYQPVWGYPALYEHEATAFAADVPADAVAQPLEVPIGVLIEPRWDESLRVLEVELP
ncbi:MULTISPECIES: hypothetical protein [unclassified Agrococcus]|uniref:hypothetical protein n=1 Tax=unclassified Agrococcus TaxID=2615065 RepID=UPI003605F0E4